MDRFSLEVKVGLVVVFTAGLVLAFIFILGDWNPFTNTYKITVTLQYAGGIKPGADVHLAGARVGKVDAIRYLPIDQKDPNAPIVGLELLIDKRAQQLIREDSEFAVQMESLLGGKMVEISPGTPSEKVLADGAVKRGEDPPQLEALINQGVTLLENVSALMEEMTPEDKKKLRELLSTVARFGPEDMDEIKQILKNGAAITEDMKAITKEVGPKVGPMLSDLEGVVAEVKPRIGPMMRELEATLVEVRPTVVEARDLLRELDKTVAELRLMVPTDPDFARMKLDQALYMVDDLTTIADRLDRFTAKIETDYSDIDRQELERILRQFFQQEGITINVRKIYSDPNYPTPPGADPAASPWNKNGQAEPPGP